MRFAALGSGSKGNAWVVVAGDDCVLIDCGFGPREMARRLLRLGLVPEQISAVCVTHEHTDHIGGLAACVRRFGWRAWMSAGTRAAHQGLDALPIETLACGGAVDIGALAVQPVTVPHDAREPVQFVISDGVSRLGILTDVGHVTTHMVQHFGACDALVLECNHDSDMLQRGRYPPALKRRIGGGYGHLANDAAANLLRHADLSRLRHVVAAHLSEENNAPALAQKALATVLDCDAGWIAVADQDAGIGWREM